MAELLKRKFSTGGTRIYSKLQRLWHRSTHLRFTSLLAGASLGYAAAAVAAASKADFSW